MYKWLSLKALVFLFNVMDLQVTCLLSRSDYVKFCLNSGYELERFLENLSNRNFSIFGYDTGRFLENLGVA